MKGNTKGVEFERFCRPDAEPSSSASSDSSDSYDVDPSFCRPDAEPSSSASSDSSDSYDVDPSTSVSSEASFSVSFCTPTAEASNSKSSTASVGFVLLFETCKGRSKHCHQFTVDQPRCSIHRLSYPFPLCCKRATSGLGVIPVWRMKATGTNLGRNLVELPTSPPKREARLKWRSPVSSSRQVGIVVFHIHITSICAPQTIAIAANT